MERTAGCDWDVLGDGRRGYTQPSSPWTVTLTILQQRNDKTSAAIKARAAVLQALGLSALLSFQKIQGTSHTWEIPPSSWQPRGEGLGEAGGFVLANGLLGVQRFTSEGIGPCFTIRSMDGLCFSHFPCPFANFIHLAT